MWKKNHLHQCKGGECIYLDPTQCLTSSYFQTPYALPFIPFYVEKVFAFQLPYS